MHTKPLTLDDLHNKAKHVNNLFHSYAKFGAADTEPMANIRLAIRQSVKNGTVTLPPGDENKWELYESEGGWKRVETILDTAVSEMLDMLLSMRLGDIRDAKRVMTKWFFVDWNYRD